MTRSLYLRIAMLLMLTAPCLPLFGQNSPFGACSFVADSSGATSDAGVSISLTFGAGGTLSFVGSGSTQVSDQGTYSVSGNSITISLPDMGKSAHGSWTLAGKCPDIALPALLERCGNIEVDLHRSGQFGLEARAKKSSSARTRTGARTRLGIRPQPS